MAASGDDTASAKPLGQACGPEDHALARVGPLRRQPGWRPRGAAWPSRGRSEIASPTSRSTQVVLADDHELQRRSWRLRLESQLDLQVVSAPGDLFTLRRQVNGHAPDVLLLDLRMPNASSVALIRSLRAASPETKIVIVTVQDSPAFARAAIEAGAIGYVLEETADSEVALATARAVRGESYLSPRVAAAIHGLRLAAGEDGLSGRETEVLRLIALGLTSTEIADELHVSRRTVETHRARIHRKLGVAKRWELVRYALARHLIGPEPDVARASEDDDD